MPDIDPAALSRFDSTSIAVTTPSLLFKSLPNPAPKPSKSPQPGLRVDIEPFYTALKGAIGNDWSKYKESVSQFILGHRNQRELGRLIDHIVAIDDTVLHLHNQLICAIHCNVLRDVPDSGVAWWVSANDKPTNVSKPASGDAAEQRLKNEVMQLPPRIRHRLKAIQDEPAKPFPASLLTHRRDLRQYPSLSASLIQPASSLPSSSTTIGTTIAGGLNNDVEIRRRYTAPLPSETLDLPSSTNLSDRLLPICYEEGLSSVPAKLTMCAELLATATETFVKEALGSFVSKARLNTLINSHVAAQVAAIHIPSKEQQQQQNVAAVRIEAGAVGGGRAAGVLTARYKRPRAKGEAACIRGDIKVIDRVLPCKVVTAQDQESREDLHMAWEVGDFWLGSLLPWLGESSLGGEFEPYGEDVDVVEYTEYVRPKSKVAKMKIVGPLTNKAPYINGKMYTDSVDPDEEDWAWQGALAQEREVLASLLDDCLAAGQ